MGALAKRAAQGRNLSVRSEFESAKKMIEEIFEIKFADLGQRMNPVTIGPMIEQAQNRLRWSLKGSASPELIQIFDLEWANYQKNGNQSEARIEGQELVIEMRDGGRFAQGQYELLLRAILDRINFQLISAENQKRSKIRAAINDQRYQELKDLDLMRRTR